MFLLGCFPGSLLRYWSSSLGSPKVTMQLSYIHGTLSDQCSTEQCCIDVSDINSSVFSVYTEIPDDEVHPGHWYDLNNHTHVWNQMGSDPIQSQEWVLFPLLFVRPNLQSRLSYKPLEGILPVALASLIEVHRRTVILLLFVICLIHLFFYFVDKFINCEKTTQTMSLPSQSFVFLNNFLLAFQISTVQ